MSSFSSAQEEQASIADLISTRRTGWMLPREFYTSPDVFKADTERVLRRSWLYAGHMSRIPRRGDYFLYEVEGESIIVVHAGHGSVHALRNTCRHRGSRADYVMAMRFTPLTETTTPVAIEWLVAPDAVQNRDFEIERLEAFWRLTAEQDWRLCEENQRGVNTFGCLPGPYAPEERGVEQFVEWYIGRLRT